MNKKGALVTEIDYFEGNKTKKAIKTISIQEDTFNEMWAVQTVNQFRPPLNVFATLFRISSREEREKNTFFSQTQHNYDWISIPLFFRFFNKASCVSRIVFSPFAIFQAIFYGSFHSRRIFLFCAYNSVFQVEQKVAHSEKLRKFIFACTFNFADVPENVARSQAVSEKKEC